MTGNKKEISALAQSYSVTYLTIGVIDFDRADMKKIDYEFLDGSSPTLTDPWSPSFITGAGSKWCTKIDVAAGKWVQMLCEDTSGTDLGIAVCEMVVGASYTPDMYGKSNVLARSEISRICRM